MILSTLIFMLFAYLLGSVCSAVIVCKVFHLPDPRSTGSNNPGATNVLRIAGKSKAAMVLVADMLKGFLPVLLAYFCSLNFLEMGFVGLLAVIGHVFPLFYQFKGGKGVATAIGVYFGLCGWFGLICLATWLVVFKLTRYSSLSSLIMVAIAPIGAFFLFVHAVWFPILLIAALVIFNHHENIQRLLDGKESKFKK